MIDSFLSLFKKFLSTKLYVSCGEFFVRGTCKVMILYSSRLERLSIVEALNGSYVSKLKLKFFRVLAIPCPIFPRPIIKILSSDLSNFFSFNRIDKQE